VDLTEAATIIQSMSASRRDAKAQHAGCYSLWKLLYGNDSQRRAIAAAGGVRAITGALESDPLDAELQEAGCAALASLVIDAGAARDAAGAGSIDVAISVMKNHPADAAVQSAALVLLANLSAV
jgi:hypothetical protein